jgi:hypothetical protein
MQVEVVLRAGAGVGESPVWCDRCKLLWWVDIPADQPKLEHGAADRLRRAHHR